MKKSKVSICGIIVSFLILCIPIAYIIYCEMNSYIMSGRIIVPFIVPFLLALIPILIRKVPDIVKIIVPIMIFAVTLFGLYWLNGVGGNTEFRTFHGENEINEYYDDFDFSNFGEYSVITNYYYNSTGIFEQTADTSILKYDKVDFENQIKYIENRYEFHDEPIVDGEPVPVFDYENFYFRVEKSKSPRYWYPKQLYLVGINYESNEIAYVSFEDDELDVVSDFNDILYFYCGWQFIIN